MGKKECKKYNSLGECIEWLEIGDKKILQFKESAKGCNPEMLAEWTRLTRDKKIKVMPED